MAHEVRWKSNSENRNRIIVGNMKRKMAGSPRKPQPPAQMFLHEVIHLMRQIKANIAFSRFIILVKSNKISHEIHHIHPNDQNNDIYWIR